LISSSVSPCEWAPGNPGTYPTYKPEKVILFGSFAEDDIHEWSDIDMVIIKETSLRPIE
jgi:predicted nucleotidyltransferase